MVPVPVPPPARLARSADNTALYTMEMQAMETTPTAIPKVEDLAITARTAAHTTASAAAMGTQILDDDTSTLLAE